MHSWPDITTPFIQTRVAYLESIGARADRRASDRPDVGAHLEVASFARLSLFLRALPSLTTAAAVASAASAVAAPLGLPSVTCGAFTTNAGTLDGRVYLTNWSPRWLQVYLATVLPRDPVVLEARRRAAPFTWQEMSADVLGDAWRDVREQFRQQGWQDGLTIPIHGPGGYLAVFSFAGPAAVDVTAATRGVLFSVAHAAHQRGRELFKGEMSASPRLTTRERQVMRWIANGKTDGEIAVILSLAAATVHSYAEQAKRKLGACTRPQAVAEMARCGLL